MRLFCVHGWSFDASFWEPLATALPDAELTYAEFGYFGAPPSLTPPDAPYLAIGHSAGALWLLEQDLPGCIGIVAINGFARFTSGPDLPFGQNPRVLDRMRRALPRDPERVVADFRALIGVESPCGPVATAPLADGLERLAQGDARARVSQVFAVAGSADPLVDPRHMRATFGPECALVTLPGGHCLPLSHATECADLVRSAWARWS